jgi:RNA polymerase sigma-70 factor (ECF subfamily)
VARVFLNGVPDSDPRQQDDTRLKLLYERYWPELCRYIRVTFGSGPPDPQDVAQSAFARYLALDNRDAVDNPRAFLYTTARNIALDFNRHLKHATRHTLREAQNECADKLDECSPERITLARERAKMLAAVIENLPHRQRQALLLHRLHGLSYGEIAARTGASKSDVSRQISRALEAVETALGEHE